MNTPPQDIVLLPESPNNTNNKNDNNNVTTTNILTNILTNNNMIQSSRAGLISSSPLDSNLPISAISESEVRMSASELVVFNLPAPLPLSGLSNVLPSRPINIINPIFYLSNKRDPPFIGIPSCEGRRG